MPTYQDYRALLVDGADGWHEGGEVIRYHFLSSVPDYYDYDPDFGDYDVGGEYLPEGATVNMDPAERQMMLQAVAAWNEVANLNLIPARGGVVDLTFASAHFADAGLFGFIADFPAPADLGTRPSAAGDLWLNNSNPNQYVPGIGPILGHTSWNTYLHELGHALGLHHPNEMPENPTTPGQFTVMSYLPHPGEADLDTEAQGWALTPMLWDIQAMQALYGANTETRTDATVYLGDGDGRGTLAYQYGADGMTVQGGDGVARNVSLTIWDAGGQDLMDASDIETNSRIDLRPGQYSSIGALENNVAMAAAVRLEGRTLNLIEDAWGGAGHDHLIGNGAPNELLGNAGRDTLAGARGGDELSGGQGSDRLQGGKGHDALTGGRGRDTLKGGAGQDRLDGGDGNDRMAGGRGADVFVFSQGADVVIDFQRDDRLDMRATTGISDFADLRDDHLEVRGTDLVIRDDNGWSLTLQDIALDALRADDFLF
ncbi:putative metallopeptidase (plasmid) [Phaeobacter piscinae]|uniref:Metallopeptidase n=1 Tax=Phaeobacter piscinae TaxID=1580596 RepID=A0AAN1GVM6_9RHOB|nr:M10 family metallopeptidase C-terminal domain-containing protein [Phaeobacter piscinae]ATG45979.1 putative metallopeptidase [Phaeobacter piscinae]AUR38302.1 putative metallopeptidase [Phaeobacter piscinae]